ncbi:MAG: hypothetical protein FJ211_04445 [Ignavibacteria bacterium]|nr:hypothetical protein [Ignavibacteria bacterium]
MANVTAYLHPERLLVATWVLDGGIAVIQDYKELAPDANIDLRSIATETIQLIIHSSHARFHWFPVDTSTRSTERAQFEQQAWFERSAFMYSEKIEMPTVIHCEGYEVQAVAAVTEQIRSRCQELGGNDSLIAIDYTSDVHAALSSIKQRSEPWLLLSRRGAHWYASVIGANHKVLHFAAFPHDNDYSNQAMIMLIVSTIGQRYDTVISALLLCGDVITSDEIQETKDALVQDGIKVSRLQPFKTMQSQLSEKNAQRLLRRAHVISPLAGAILQQQLLATTQLL